uniref:Uncharacterized protein n=1 Tax=Ascaris lumbricoides TaxID=6252 RepID=A0A0M3ICU2_ASCLU
MKIFAFIFTSSIIAYAICATLEIQGNDLVLMTDGEILSRRVRDVNDIQPTHIVERLKRDTTPRKPNYLKAQKSKFFNRRI